MDDKENVQEEKTSTEETTSKEAEPKVEEKAEEQPKEQPFSEEQEARMQQLIAQTTSTAKEEGRREMQGVKDREVAEANRQTRLAQNETASYKTSFGNLDEETQKDVELARYREQEKSTRSFAQEELQKQQETDFWGRVNNQVLTNLDNLGIPRDDKRLDWGDGSRDLPEARARLDSSIAKILNEGKKVTEEKQEQRFKDFETKIRKDLNLDSVDTTTGSGGGSDSDAEFKKGIGDGSLPLNKTNMARAKKMGLAK